MAPLQVDPPSYLNFHHSVGRCLQEPVHGGASAGRRYGFVEPGGVKVARRVWDQSIDVRMEVQSVLGAAARRQHTAPVAGVVTSAATKLGAQRRAGGRRST